MSLPAEPHPPAHPGAVPARELMSLVRAGLADEAASWSMGTFGAVAEFLRLPGESAELREDARSATVVTFGGGIRVEPADGVRPFAYQRPVGAASWATAVALCLPADGARRAGRTVVTELGRDAAALRAGDRDDVLFDLGLGAHQVDACVRTGDPDALALLRDAAGRSLFDVPELAAALQRLSPHRVFRSGLGRAEVYGPIPPPHGRSPEAPHTHLLPALLRHGRTHAATDPIPDGWVPVAYLHPAHPAKDVLGRSTAFDAARDEAAEALLARYGDLAARAAATSVAAAVRAGDPPDACWSGATGPRRAAARVTLRRLAHHLPDSEVLATWRAAVDPSAGPDHPPAHPAEC